MASLVCAPGVVLLVDVAESAPRPARCSDAQFFTLLVEAIKDAAMKECLHGRYVHLDFNELKDSVSIVHLGPSMQNLSFLVCLGGVGFKQGYRDDSKSGEEPATAWPLSKNMAFADNNWRLGEWRMPRLEPRDSDSSDDDESYVRVLSLQEAREQAASDFKGKGKLLSCECEPAY